MPVSNHDMMIATTKTGHVARAYPGTDRCWNAPHNEVIFGDNYIDTKYLGTGKTTKTFIDGANIWTSVGLIDGAPSDPAHAGVGGGTESMTYRKEAAPTTYSKDVKFEGNGCVRTDDKTTQNHKNCSGFVDGSNVKGQVDSAADYLKKKCVVDTLAGHCEHDRELGAPPNGKTDEAFHLDVVGVDVVTLTVTRKDLIANKPSGCADHTYWTASRAGVGQGLSSRLDHLGDTFVVRGHILADPWTGAGALKTDENHDDKSTAQIGADPQSPKSPKTGDEKRYAERREATQSTLREYEQTTGKSSGFEKVTPLPMQTGKGNFMPQKAPTGPDVVQSVADKRTEEYNKSLDKARKQRAIATAIKDLEKAIAFWLIEREPPVVNITALACGGAKHVKLQVFPKDKITFDLFSEALNAKFQLIRDISKIVEYVSGKFGIAWSLKFLEKPNVKLDVAYKELTHDKNGFSKTQVRKAWTLNFGFDPFFEAAVKASMPLLPFLAAVATPAVAQAAKWLLDKAGVEINAFIELKMAFNPSISATLDQYNDGFCSGPKCTLVTTFSAGLEAKIGSWGAAEIRGYVEGTIALEAWKFSPAPGLVQADLTGVLQFGISGFIKVSWWYIEASGSFDWRPNGGKFPKGKDKTTKITTFNITVK